MKDIKELVLTDMMSLSIGYLMSVEKGYHEIQAKLEEKRKADPKFVPSELEDMEHSYLFSMIVMLTDILHPVYDKTEDLIPVAKERFAIMKNNIVEYKKRNFVNDYCKTHVSCKVESNDIKESDGQDNT